MIRDGERLASAGYRARLAQCIHCGMCLQACPTYLVQGTELDSPRGRIALMAAAAGGKLSLQDLQTTFAEHIDLCLACRACESASRTASSKRSFPFCRGPRNSEIAT